VVSFISDTAFLSNMLGASCFLVTLIVWGLAW